MAIWVIGNRGKSKSLFIVVSKTLFEGTFSLKLLQINVFAKANFPSNKTLQILRGWFRPQHSIQLLKDAR